MERVVAEREVESHDQEREEYLLNHWKLTRVCVCCIYVHIQCVSRPTRGDGAFECSFACKEIYSSNRFS